MNRGGFRHLVVADGDPVGVISVLDIMRTWTGERWRHRAVQIREAMRRDFLEVEGTETVGEAARQMVERGLGAAVVTAAKPKSPPGLVTDRDVLRVAAAGHDPGTEQVADHLSATDDVLGAGLVAQAGRRGDDQGRLSAHRRGGPRRDRRDHLDQRRRRRAARLTARLERAGARAESVVESEG
jgi:Predicted transcriptional regulator, contains C-terminal CBS domains